MIAFVLNQTEYVILVNACVFQNAVNAIHCVLLVLVSIIADRLTKKLAQHRAHLVLDLHAHPAVDSRKRQTTWINNGQSVALNDYKRGLIGTWESVSRAWSTRR